MVLVVVTGCLNVIVCEVYGCSKTDGKINESKNV